MKRRTTTILLAVILLAAGTSCEDSIPPFDHEIRVETARFFPADLTITVGQTVRWANVLRRSEENVRTVTSGTGPGDPAAGELFDVELEGFGSGQIVGDTFTRTFTETDTLEYFSRLPEGGEFTGRLQITRGGTGGEKD